MISQNVTQSISLNTIQLQQIVLFMCIAKALLSPQESGVTVSFQDFIGGGDGRELSLFAKGYFRLPRPNKNENVWCYNRG